MTRAHILAEFTVSDNGIIQDLGKFEGEMLYVPYFWHWFLDGEGDQDTYEDCIVFDVSAQDRKEFPEIPQDQSKVVLYQREDGFVCEVDERTLFKA